ncbi:hypothetical protein GCM10028796_12880 [Ramlibacter monticola]
MRTHDAARPGFCRRGTPRDALAAFSTMVGAIVLGRALDDPELVDEFLSAARESV